MTCESFVAALTSLGVPCVVEADQRLAIIRPCADALSLADESLRARVVALAIEHGFSHVAVELDDVQADEGRAVAAVSGN